jgi:hypothetical protein
MAEGQSTGHGGNIEDLIGLWQTLDIGYNRPEKFVAEALDPIINFCRYKAIECVAN